MKMQQPIISPDVLEWLRKVCDVPASKKDTGQVLRWKAAQRDVYIQALAVHGHQLKSSQGKGDRAASMNIKVRAED